MTLAQFFQQLYPQTLAMNVDDIRLRSELVLHLSRRKRRNICPYCGQASRNLHSRYERTLADLPCVKRRITIKLAVRRFRCMNKACAERTFAERFTGLALPYARHTERLAAVLKQVGLRVGAEPGAKLLKAFAIEVSADKLLSSVHQLKLSEPRCPQRIGIDDFALCKGTSYGTLVVDLEQGKPLELLPSREVDVVSEWLGQQPQVEQVARDRSRAYAQAITKGAPQAVQVMDRWHVLKNLREALEKDIGRRYADMKQVFEAKGLLGKPIPRSRREREAQVLVLEKQRRQYDQVQALNREGVTIVQMAKRLGLSRGLVRTHLRASSPPQAQQNRRRTSPLDPFRSQLETRYREGRMTMTAVWRELVKLGYAGSYQPVRRWFHERRQLPATLIGLRISPRHFASLFVKDETKLNKAEQLIITTLDTMPELKQLRAEAVRYREALLHRGAESMRRWLDAAADTPFTSLRHFAIGLEQEWPALEATCSSPLSNGPTEGAVNRLKLIKRQMYGRGSFALLRKRVLLT